MDKFVRILNVSSIWAFENQIFTVLPLRFFEVVGLENTELVQFLDPLKTVLKNQIHIVREKCSKKSKLDSKIITKW